METPVTIIELTVEITLFGVFTEDEVDLFREQVINVLSGMDDQVHEVKVTLDDVADSGIIDADIADELKLAIAYAHGQEDQRLRDQASRTGHDMGQ
jgi:hypothetical protein